MKSVKNLIALVIIGLFFYNGVDAKDVTGGEPESTSRGSNSEELLTLEDAIQIAIGSNPTIAMFEARWKASRAAVPQAGAWMDPVIRFGVNNLPATGFEFDKEPMTGKLITLMQRVPFPGKLPAKKEAVGYESGAREKDFEEVRNATVAKVKQAYFDLFYFNKAVEIIERNRAILASFVDIAQTKFSVGMGIQQDVLRAEVELSIMDEKLISFKRMRVTSVARLNTLMSRPVDTKISRIEKISKVPYEYDESALISKAKKTRPLLEATDKRVQSSIEMTKFARKSYYPDFNLGISYVQRADGAGSGVDFLSFGVGVNIPIFAGSKQSKQIEEARAIKRMSEEQYSSVLNDIEYEIRDLHIKILEKENLLELFDTSIIPQAEQSLKSALSGYQVGKVDFLALVDNEITLFNYELKRFRILADYRNIQARLEAVVGERLF